jgi:hypothetical protein
MAMNYLGMKMEEAYTEAREQLVQSVSGSMVVAENQMDMEVTEAMMETDHLEPGGTDMNSD